MEWMKQYSYIAAWLSPIVALVGMLIRGNGKGIAIDWARMMLYIGFLTCLAAVFTPALEQGCRGFAGTVVAVIAGFLMFQVGLEARVRREAERKEKGLRLTPP